MTLKEALFELINEDVLIDFDEQNNAIEIVELHEGRENYKPENCDKLLQSVATIGIKKEEFIIAFKPDEDKYRFLGDLIKTKKKGDKNSRKSLKKSCDGIIFCEIDNQHYILAVELKSENPKDLQKKYKAVKLFLIFLNEILKMYYNITREFIVINVLFDKNPQKGKPFFLPIPKQRVENKEIYFRQGFKRKNEDKENNRYEAKIKRILDALNEEIRGNNDITYLNY